MLYLSVSQFIFVVHDDFQHTLLEFCWQRLWFVVNANVKAIAKSIILGIAFFFFFFLL